MSARRPGKQKTHRRAGQWVYENVVNVQNPTAALFSSSAFDGSRFHLQFTRGT
jgi:hypothetical protein